MFTFSVASAMSHIQYDKSIAKHDSVQVSAVCLDERATYLSLSSSLLKIDVEVAEGEVLLGASSILAKNHPIILCEVLNDEAGKRVIKALPDGYPYYRIDEVRCLSLRPAVNRERWRDKNWLFIHSNHVNLVTNLL